MTFFIIRKANTDHKVVKLDDTTFYVLSGRNGKTWSKKQVLTKEEYDRCLAFHKNISTKQVQSA